MNGESHFPKNLELVVGMSAETVRARLGPPLRVEARHWPPGCQRWDYPEEVVVELWDIGDGLQVKLWKWEPTQCPRCGKVLRRGVSRCWADGCDFVIPTGFGTVPFLDLGDGRTIQEHWAERPRTPTVHGDTRAWTLSLNGEPFRYFERGQETWTPTFEGGKEPPLHASRNDLADGRIEITYSMAVDFHTGISGFSTVEAEIDPARMIVTYRITSKVDLDL